MNVTIIGTGYVGLTTGVALAFLGHHVRCVDKDPAKVALLEDGKSPIHEHGMEQLIKAARKRLMFTTDLAEGLEGASVVVIAVGTPAAPDGTVNVTFVEEAAREVGDKLAADGEYTVVVKSTVPVGTNRRVENAIRAAFRQRGEEADVVYASNPEFLREGKALFDTLYPDRIVVGAKEDRAFWAMRRLYAHILDQSFTPPSFLARPQGYQAAALVECDPTSAEMIKYAANAFLAIKISYINELAGLCDRTGADITHVSRGIGLDNRIGAQFLRAGLGWGGSCFPKDTSALIAQARECGYELHIVEAARAVNDNQRHVIVEKLQSALKVLRGRTVGILGLAFKPDTDDVRDAPAVDVIGLLLELGAHVRVHDPVAMDNARVVLEGLEVEYFDDPYELADGADGLVLATEWGAYRDLDLERISDLLGLKVIVDGRNMFEPATAEEAGLTYIGVGR